MINGVPAEKIYPHTFPALPPVSLPSTLCTTLGTSCVSTMFAIPMGVFLKSGDVYARRTETVAQAQTIQ